MNTALKSVLLGTLTAIALFPTSDAVASSAEAGPFKRRCFQEVKLERKGINLAPGQEIEIGRWKQTCNSNTRTAMSSIPGLQASIQRLIKGHWTTHTTRPWLDKPLDYGESYRLVVTNASSKPVRFDVSHKRGGY